jgi:hypothetical protein
MDIVVADLDRLVGGSVRASLLQMLEVHPFPTGACREAVESQCRVPGRLMVRAGR